MHGFSDGGLVAVSFTFEGKIAEIKSSGKTPRLLLHCCCAPCASYVLEYLSPLFKISILFYNPNIRPGNEFIKREAEIHRLLSQAVYPNSIDVLNCTYDAEVFESAAALLWEEPEGGQRCWTCFELRLREAAKRARDGGYDYFASTLSVSPHKNAAVLNEIGDRLAGEFGVEYLPSDFKKRNGYKRSIELSKQYDLYRQIYCGCKFETIRE